MPNFFVNLPFQNERSETIKVLLEPLSEYFFVLPGQRVVIHSICDDNTTHDNFIVAPSDKFLTIYAPGEIAGFVDCYMTCDGVRLIPDGN